MTAAELLRYREPLGRPVELVRGRLIVAEPAGCEHGRIALRIGAAILVHLDRIEHETGRRPGEVMSNDPGCWIERGPDTVRAPDIAFVAADRLPPQPVIDYLETAPTIAVEVLSPTDRPRAVRAKVAQWLRRGAELVWVVDPQQRTVSVHRSSEPPRVVGVEDTLDAEPVLPGFRLRLATLFRGGAAS